MPAFYLNSYGPLVMNRAGRLAAEKYGFDPFIDGSIRREPDLEHEYPSISCLCRGGNFAPRLQVGDVVAYMTKSGIYHGSKTRHHRLMAVLRVKHTFPNHPNAARWYAEQKLELPSNCMVAENEPKPLDESHRIFRAGTCVGDARTHKMWNAAYRVRSIQHGAFVACEKLWHDLTYDAPLVTRSGLENAFGYYPGTFNPGALDPAAFKRFLESLHIPALLSGQ